MGPAQRLANRSHTPRSVLSAGAGAVPARRIRLRPGRLGPACRLDSQPAPRPHSLAPHPVQSANPLRRALSRGAGKIQDHYDLPAHDGGADRIQRKRPGRHATACRDPRRQQILGRGAALRARRRRHRQSAPVTGLERNRPQRIGKRSRPGRPLLRGPHPTRHRRRLSRGPARESQPVPACGPRYCAAVPASRWPLGECHGLSDTRSAGAADEANGELQRGRSGDNLVELLHGTADGE